MNTLRCVCGDIECSSCGAAHDSRLAIAMLEADLRIANSRIAQLCKMVCNISGNPRKVNVKDFIVQGE